MSYRLNTHVKPLIWVEATEFGMAFWKCWVHLNAIGESLGKQTFLLLLLLLFTSLLFTLLISSCLLCRCQAVVDPGHSRSRIESLGPKVLRPAFLWVSALPFDAFCNCEGTWSKQSPSSNRPDPTVNLNNSPPWQIQYEMWGDVMSKCVHFALRRSVANNVEIHIPVPSDVDSPSFKTSIGTVRYIPDQAANAATRWVLAVQGTVFTCL